MNEFCDMSKENFDEKEMEAIEETLEEETAGISKEEMLKEIEDSVYENDLSENPTFAEVYEVYSEMQEEFDDAVGSMYPNGRDEDAENFD